MSYRILLACVAVLLMGCEEVAIEPNTEATVASQGPLGRAIEWPVDAGGNGHFYEFVAHRGVTWSDAKSAAETRVRRGRQGRLVTISS